MENPIANVKMASSKCNLKPLIHMAQMLNSEGFNRTHDSSTIQNFP